MGDKRQEGTFLPWAASTTAKYDKSARRRPEERRLGMVDWVLEDTVPTKSPPRGWRKIAMDLLQDNNCNSSQTVVKGANSRNRGRSDSISSTKLNLTYAKPPDVSPTEPDAASPV